MNIKVAAFTVSKRQVIYSMFPCFTQWVLNLSINELDLSMITAESHVRDLLYKLKNIVGSDHFSAQFIKIITHYKKDWL